MTNFKWTLWNMYTYSDNFIYLRILGFFVACLCKWNEIRVIVVSIRMNFSYFFLCCHFIKILWSVPLLEKTKWYYECLNCFILYSDEGIWKHLLCMSWICHLLTLFVFQVSTRWLYDEYRLKRVEDSLSSRSYRLFCSHQLDIGWVYCWGKIVVNFQCCLIYDP